MVPYNRDKEPGWQWMNSSIQATIVLDQTNNTTYTNLDEITGRVILRCSKAVSIKSIVVKLEGESRTRLLGTAPGGQDRDAKVSLEYHKILYKVATVFPPTDVQKTRNGAKDVFTLPAGSHDYAFKFKLPFNNACHTPDTAIPGVRFGMSSRGLEVTQEPTSHVKKTLPPTLTGFPGEAEISYFVKATINREGLLKENPRAFSPFNFVPIEPPRPEATGSQIFARQRHAFNPVSDLLKKEKKKSIWSKSSALLDKSSATDPPFFSVDIRLPEPAILTCNRELPLSILIKKLNSSQEVVYVQSLQIMLIGYTRVKAHEFERTESNSWVTISKSNMNIKIGNVGDPEGTETLLDDKLWRGIPLPNTVAPSFETCNISRKYQIDIRIGLSYGHGNLGMTKPQSVILPLRLDTLVYSGIAPPQEALARLTATRINSQVVSTSSSVPAPGISKLETEGRAQAAPSIAQVEGETASAAQAPPLPTRPDHGEVVDAPPSYEDAIAQDLPPVDGYRPVYSPGPSGTDPLLHTDEKKGLH